MSNTWTGLGIGTKDSKGEWLEMFFSEEKISSSDINSSSKIFEKVIVNDSEAPHRYLRHTSNFIYFLTA